MARIPYFDMSKASPAFQQLDKAKHPMNIYRMLPYIGKAADGFIQMGGAQLRDGKLDPRLREIAILRVGRLSDARYEVHQHTRIGRKAGLSDEKMAALVKGAPQTALDELEREVVAFTDHIVAHVKAPDAMFHAMGKRLGHEALAELVMIIGFYMMVCRFLENFEVDIESQAPRT